MKIKILLLYIGMLLPIVSNAENSCSGIYRTAEDYQNNLISIIADTTQYKAVRIDDFFFRPYVWIKTSNGKKRIRKREIFAVRMPNKRIYRIVNNENYLLLDTTGIYIYSQEKEVSVPVNTVHSTRFKREKVTKYFFSTTKTSAIQHLNITNVRLALIKDKQFDNELISHFPTDKSLFVINKTGQFKINDFLKSINK